MSIQEKIQYALKVKPKRTFVGDDSFKKITKEELAELEKQCLPIGIPITIHCCDPREYAGKNSD